MQFIETSYLGVRSAVYRLVRDGHPVEFVLFPMIHVGSPAFYQAVQKRLERCDLILVEGVQSRSALQVGRAYGIVEKARGSGLVAQSNGLDLQSLRSKLEGSDLSADAFDAGWRRVPLWERLLLVFGMPLLVAAMCVSGPKRALSQFLQEDDLPSRTEVDVAGEFASDAVIVDERNQHLVERITALVQESRPEPRLVGVLWGAGHMRAVVGLLLGPLRYRVADAEWLTVFSF